MGFLHLRYNMRIYLPLLAIIVSSCSEILSSHKYELTDGNYRLSLNRQQPVKVEVFVEDDSVMIYEKESKAIVPVVFSQQQKCNKRSFDVDVMSIAFKYRPQRSTLPAQLTTDFNGNVYFGYRIDQFKFSNRETPFGQRKKLRHRAVTAGVFTGIGSTALTPWTTNGAITDEYSGFEWSRGVALMIGVNNLTVGGGVGWDHLRGRDKEVWIYQNKPWYGVTIGLNIN